MTKFFTCEDCRYRKKMACMAYNGMPLSTLDRQICFCFMTKDGQTPRYCRMAWDIYVMAEEMLYMGYDKAGCEGWVFRDKLYFSKDRAIEAAKSWLMEFEDGNE